MQAWAYQGSWSLWEQTSTTENILSSMRTFSSNWRSSMRMSECLHDFISLSSLSVQHLCGMREGWRCMWHTDKFPLCWCNRTAAPYLSLQVIQIIPHLVLCGRVIIKTKKRKEKRCFWLAAAIDWPSLKSPALLIFRTSCSEHLQEDRGPLITLTRT